MVASAPSCRSGFSPKLPRCERRSRLSPSHSGRDRAHPRLLRQRPRCLRPPEFFGTTDCFDDLFSARASGHRAPQLTRERGQERRLIVPVTSRPLARFVSTDLDQLRRQAKERLEAFAAGDAGAVAEAHAYDRSAEAAHFALHDAQFVLARSYGSIVGPSSRPEWKALQLSGVWTRCVAAISIKSARC